MAFICVKILDVLIISIQPNPLAEQGESCGFGMRGKLQRSHMGRPAIHPVAAMPRKVSRKVRVE